MHTYQLRIAIRKKFPFAIHFSEEDLDQSALGNYKSFNSKLKAKNAMTACNFKLSLFS